jgi:hypothetical protein
VVKHGPFEESYSIGAILYQHISKKFLLGTLCSSFLFFFWRVFVFIDGALGGLKLRVIIIFGFFTVATLPFWDLENAYVWSYFYLQKNRNSILIAQTAFVFWSSFFDVATGFNIGRVVKL